MSVIGNGSGFNKDAEILLQQEFSKLHGGALKNKK